MACTNMAAITPYCYIGHNPHGPPVAVAAYYSNFYMLPDIVHEWGCILTDKAPIRERSILHTVSNYSCAVQNRVRIFSHWFCFTVLVYCMCEIYYVLSAQLSFLSQCFTAQ